MKANWKILILIFILVLLSLNGVYAQFVGGLFEEEGEKKPGKEIFSKNNINVFIDDDGVFVDAFFEPEKFNKRKLKADFAEFYKSIDDKSNQAIERYYRDELARGIDIKRTIFIIEDADDGKINTITKRKFIEFELGKKGVPSLNYILLYSIKQKGLRIAYARGCLYDKARNEVLLKNYEEKIKLANSDSEIKKYLLELNIELYRISHEIAMSDKFIQNGIYANILDYCPETKISQYEITKNVEEKSCKPFFDGDTFKDGRIKILLLGSNFNSEQEFKESIQKNLIDESLKIIEPYKKYTKNGNDGLFYFVYGDHDINFNSLRALALDEIIGRRVYECPNTFYTIVLIKEGDKTKKFRSINIYDKKLILSISNPIVLAHEFGHSFGLNDEYTEERNKKPEKMLINCANNPKSYKSVLEWLGDYGFKGCAYSEEYFRTSYDSIMRNSYNYFKFNYLGCLVLVREFENVENIDDNKVVSVCKDLYLRGELQLTDEVSDKDPLYLYCLDSLPNNDADCKRLALFCAKNEDFLTHSFHSSLFGLSSKCINQEIDKLKGGKNE